MSSEMLKHVDAVAAELAWEQTPLGTVLIDAGGRVCAANPAAAGYLSMRVDDLVGISEADFAGRSENLDHRRMELAQAGLGSMHFIRRSNDASSANPRLARIAEELREPLASIYGFAELLIHQSYDEETRRDLTITMLGDIEVMIDLINRQLDLANG
jgi:signal transduction histidine kinase